MVFVIVGGLGVYLHLREEDLMVDNIVDTVLVLHIDSEALLEL